MPTPTLSFIPFPITLKTGGATAAAAGGPAAFRPAFKGLGGGGGGPLSDLDAYPILTEEIGYPPSPIASTSSGTAGMPASAPIGAVAFKAVADVLGWKPKIGDTKGFLGALTASFTLKEVEGHTEATWSPRSYSVMSDLSGGISGAQATIYARALEAVNQALPMLDGLYPLDTEADAQDIASLKSIVRSQFNELASELALPGGPRVTRVNQIFSILLGTPFFSPLIASPTDPDVIGGQLGQLRDLMGLWSVVVANASILPKTILINTVDEEQNVTNYRIMVDYITSLQNSWLNNQQFFGLNSTTPFFGTQLVILSRQLSVVSDAVDEVRFTMDSVFITPSERQTMMIVFPAGISNQPLFVEDLLSWVQRFAIEEGPRLIQDGGKYGVISSVVPVVTQLLSLVQGAMTPMNATQLPKGYFTQRVMRSWQDLAGQLMELSNLCSPITFQMPPKE